AGGGSRELFAAFVEVGPATRRRTPRLKPLIELAAERAARLIPRRLSIDRCGEGTVNDQYRLSCFCHGPTRDSVQSNFRARGAWQQHPCFAQRSTVHFRADGGSLASAMLRFSFPSLLPKPSLAASSSLP